MSSHIQPSAKTPSSNKHELINLKVKQLNKNWALGIQTRDYDWSPSKSKMSNAEKAFEAIKRLSYSSEKELDKLLFDDFPKEASRSPPHEHLPLLLRLLRSLMPQNQMPVGDQNKTLIFTREQQQLDIRHTTPEPEPEPEEDDFEMAPQSPSLAASHRHSLRSPAISDNSESRRKRPSEATDMSPTKQARMGSGNLGQRALASGEYSRQKMVETSQSKVPSQSLRQPPTFPSPAQAQRSFGSTPGNIASATTSFGSTNVASPNPAEIQTADTSFASISRRDSDVSISSYGPSMPSLDDTYDDFYTPPSIGPNRDICGPELPSAGYSQAGLLRTDTPSIETQSLMVEVAEPLEAQVSPRQVSPLAVTPVKNLERLTLESPRIGQDSPRNSQEHYKMSSLPKENLFIHESNEPPVAAQMPFKTRFECARVALESNLDVHDLIPESVLTITTYEHLWSYFEKFADERNLILPKRSSAKAWEDSSRRCEYVNLKAKLCFSEKPNEPLFKLQIEPIEWDKPCRFQYAFGGDRFLYLLLPDLQLPNGLKSQQMHLKSRLLEWMKGPKKFLGREWEVLHVELYKVKGKAARKKKQSSYRIVLFATKGYDILPEHGFENFKCLKHSLKPEVTIDDLVNWFMPLRKNGDLSFCKAYSRLDLGFSKAWRTFVFKPSEVRRIPDIMSDGTPEATEFNDSTLDWNGHQDLGPNTISMNDGCAMISVGACIEIWKKLNLGGALPSAFQARINGAKGVWIRSGPSDTKLQKDLDIWIEVNDSQKKFLPHDEDEDKSPGLDLTRWTFEVLKVTNKANRSALNVAFVPILKECGVHESDIKGFVKGIMDAQKHELINAVQNPVTFRSWVYKNMRTDNDRSKNASTMWRGGLPFSYVNRVSYLLEAGFTPSRLPRLGDFIEKIVKQHFSTTISNFRIPLPRSTMVIGVADPTGESLEPGEIHLAFSHSIIDDMSGEYFPFLDKQEVLVARHPSLRSSDIQKVRAVYHPALAHLFDVIVFPSKGRIPLASKLQGGDYDGDTFWVCWEPSLTRDFKNAPAPLPHQQPNPEELGIQVDRRKLDEFLSGPNPVKSFLAESFKFRLQPDLLGKCTNLHKRLAYRRNSLNSPDVVALADLHGRIIDSAKSGYIFGEDEFLKYVIKNTGYNKTTLEERGYEEVMSKGFDFAQAEIPRDIHNLRHILDILFFGLMEPEIKMALEELHTICEPKDVKDLDQVLAHPYLNEEAEGDAHVKRELQNLIENFAKIYQWWNHKMHPHSSNPWKDSSKAGLDWWADAIDKCHTQYQNLEPKSLDNPVIKTWMRRIGHGPTYWDSIKASALYHSFCVKLSHKFSAKTKFVWSMAGKQLMYIMAHQDREMHLMIGDMHANLKPKKVKANYNVKGGVVTAESELGERILRDLTQHESEEEDDEFASAVDYRELGSTADWGIEDDLTPDDLAAMEMAEFAMVADGRDELGVEGYYNDDEVGGEEFYDA